MPKTIVKIFEVSDEMKERCIKASDDVIDLLIDKHKLSSVECFFVLHNLLETHPLEGKLRFVWTGKK